MNRFSALTCALAIASFLQSYSLANGDDARFTTIPLDQVWAWWMPGTRPMQVSSKPGQPRPPEATFLRDIRRALANRPATGDAPRSGFAMLGKDLDAIREAHTVMVGGQESRDSFCSNEDISIAFFSYQAGVYVHLDQIERRGSVIRVQYKLVPHRTREATEHFALIPLGKLPVGVFSIKYEQLPLKQSVADSYRVPPTRPELAQQIVSRDFSFEVQECDSEKGS